MIRSMTGFGASCVETDKARVLVEAKSVNGRFLKIGWKGPSVLNRYEHDLETKVKQKLRRGTVNIQVFIEYKEPEDLVAVDEAVAQAYREIFSRMNLPLEGVIQLPGVVGGKNRRELDADVLDSLQEAVVQAVDALVAMREREGSALAELIEGLCCTVVQERGAIFERREEVVVSYQEKLKTRLETLLAQSETNLDEHVLAREVAVMADRSDITEEVDRLDAHIQQARELLAAGGEVGRSLDFLSQELLRESNTIGSKSGDVALARHVVKLKTTIERFKEQVANIE